MGQRLLRPPQWVWPWPVNQRPALRGSALRSVEILDAARLEQFAGARRLGEAGAHLAFQVRLLIFRRIPTFGRGSRAAVSTPPWMWNTTGKREISVRTDQILAGRRSRA